ncbi:30S ribosomal protein S4e [Candidatus Bathyarchaeota archaeon]|nr:30S ribosomal protein S4e [Candidatus Bathyarchaeota archaeon]
MGNKGPTKHLKRHQSPSHWPIHRKAGAWTIRTKPGPHSMDNSIPTTIIMRDQLNYATTASESKKLLTQGKLFVDGKPRYKKAFPVGLMDVLHIPDTKEYFRVLPDRGGKLKLQTITPDEAQFKLYRIIDKTSQKGGKTQLNLHDGSNVVIGTEKDQYKVNDVLKIKIPEKEIQDYIDFKEMQQVIVTGGRSQGARGTLLGLGPEPGWKKTATIRTPEGDDIRTLAQYIFVVGSNESMIKLDDVEEQ